MNAVSSLIHAGRDRLLKKIQEEQKKFKSLRAKTKAQRVKIRGLLEALADIDKILAEATT